MLFIMNEEEETNEEDEAKTIEFETMDLKIMEITEDTKIALQTIMGFPNKGMLILKGDIKGKSLIVLIDSGKTHNFIY